MVYKILTTGGTNVYDVGIKDPQVIDSSTRKSISVVSRCKSCLSGDGNLKNCDSKSRERWYRWTGCEFSRPATVKVY